MGCVRFQHQVAGVENVGLHAGQVEHPGVDFGEVEEDVVATPQQQRRGLVVGEVVSGEIGDSPFGRGIGQQGRRWACRVY